MRIETSAAFARRAISPTWSSNLRMLPGSRAPRAAGVDAA
jgi:hypothetical protein